MNEMLTQLAQLDISVNMREWFWVWALTYGGPMLAMCIWLAWRAEGKIDKVGEKLDNLAHKLQGMTHAMLLEVATRDGHNGLKQTAVEMLSKMPKPPQ